MTEQRRMPAGAGVRIGSPAEPWPIERIQALRDRLALIPGVAEAHLPLWEWLGQAEGPRVALVVVGQKRADPNELMSRITSILPEVLPAGEHLDVIPLDDTTVLRIVRGTNTQVVGPAIPAKRAWWQFW